jgi:plastocyanin
MRFARWAAVAGLAVFISCGGSSPTGGGQNPPPPPPGSKTVDIQDFSFSPNNVTIKVGQTIVWNNKGPSAHYVVADDGSWNSGQLNPPGGGGGYYPQSTSGSTYQHTFDQAGTFTYHCQNHPSSDPQYANFTGTITVTP